MIYEAILFDMDGVIIDTHQSVTDFWYKHAAQHSVELTQKIFEQDIYGCPSAHTLDTIFPFLTPAERQIVFDDLVAYEAGLTYNAVEGALALLQALKQNGVPAALVTSGDRAKVSEVSRQLNLNGLFAVHITTEDVEKGKPHPACYLQAAQALQKQPEQCLVFEDALAGMQAATTAGALGIGVQKSPGLATKLLKTGAWHVIPDLSQVKVRPNNNEGSLYLQIDPKHRLDLTQTL